MPAHHGSMSRKKAPEALPPDLAHAAAKRARKVAMAGRSPGASGGSGGRSATFMSGPSEGNFFIQGRMKLKLTTSRIEVLSCVIGFLYQMRPSAVMKTMAPPVPAMKMPV